MLDKLSKKIIIFIVITIFCFGFFSGCIFDGLFGTSFTLKSYSIVDDEGFPSLSFKFSCSGMVTVKLFDTLGSLQDSDLFFHGDHDSILHLSSYKNTVSPGSYKLRAYDKNNNEIFEKKIAVKGPMFSVLNCEQRWWDRDDWKGGFTLIGLNLYVKNLGDVPVYPFSSVVTIDSDVVAGSVLPCVINSNEVKSVDCFVTIHIQKDADALLNSDFFLSIKDIAGDNLASDSFSIVMDDILPVEEFRWNYDQLKRRLIIPYPEFLFDYYSASDRIHDEDYGVYVFDQYDDDYIKLLTDSLMFGFNDEDDVDRINYAASFIQNLEYKKDSVMNKSVEYARYPVETVFNEDGGGDCEDLAILTASILHQLGGYEVALFRLPDHMAVGVAFDGDSSMSGYEYYTEEYYFLETTSVSPVGHIPNSYKSRSNLTVYPITQRPLLSHSWKNGNLTIFEHTEKGDFVKVTLVVENLGSGIAEDIVVEGGCYTQDNIKLNYERDIISNLKPGMRKEIRLTVDVPSGVTTWFKTRIYLDNEVVHEKESISSIQ